MTERITITIDTENDAFAGEPASEIARILNILAADFADNGGLTYTLRPLRDSYGNTCGFCRISAEGTLT